MIVANLPEKYKGSVTTLYYQIYNVILPRSWSFMISFFRNFKTIFIYATVVRLNKKYCPYLIRWHWTFLMISGCVEGEISRGKFRKISKFHKTEF